MYSTVCPLTRIYSIARKEQKPSGKTADPQGHYNTIRINLIHYVIHLLRSFYYSNEAFANSTNPTFLYKIDIEGFEKGFSKITAQLTRLEA